MLRNNKLLMNAVSLGASVNSSAYRIENFTHVALQAVITGASSLNGAFKLQGSCDNPDASAPTNWSDITSSSATVTADGDVLWNIVDPSYNWIRVVYTRTGGSATVSVRVNAKGER